MRRIPVLLWAVAVVSLGLWTPGGRLEASAVRPAAAGPRLHQEASSLPGHVQWVSPTLSVRTTKHQLKTVTPAKVGLPLESGYRLHTDAGAQAQVVFADKSYMEMDQDADVVLCGTKPICSKHGKVEVYPAPGSHPAVQTALGTGTPHHAVFVVDVEASGTTFAVLHGVLEVQNGAGVRTVMSNQQVTATSYASLSRPVQANVRAEFGWADQIPKPDTGYDVSLHAEGAHVTAFSSQRAAARWNAVRINDGVLATGWETRAGSVHDEWVRIALPGDRLYSITNIVIDPGATGPGADPSMDLNEFELLVSPTGGTGDYTSVFHGVCRPDHTLQSFTLPAPILGKSVELLAHSNHGSASELAVAEVEIIADAAGFAFPSGVAVDGKGNMYVADTANDRVEVLSPAGNPLHSWGAKGSGPGQFRAPIGLTLDGQGNIYVADSHNNRIQKLSPSGAPLAQWGTFGTGPGEFNRPYAVALDAQRNVYVPDSRNNRIQKLSPQGTPLAQWGIEGTGPGQFEDPLGLAVDDGGNIYVADTNNNRVQKLSPQGAPMAQWTAGSAGVALKQPIDVAVGPRGNVYVADYGNFRIQKLSPQGAPLAAGPRRYPGSFAYLPSSVTLDGKGNLYATDYLNGRVVKLDGTLQVEQQYGVFGALATVLASPQGIAVDANGTVYVTDPRKALIEQRSPAGVVEGTFGLHRFIELTYTPMLGEFFYPQGIAVDRTGILYVVDQEQIQELSANSAVRILSGVSASGWVTTDGSGALYMVDPATHTVARLPAGGATAVAVGTARIEDPRGLAVDAAGNVYVADGSTAHVVKLSPEGAVLARLGANAGLRDPQGVTIDSHGDVYVGDAATDTVVKLSPAGSVLARLGSTVGIEDPRGLAVDGNDDLYVASWGTDSIVKLSPAGEVLAVWQ